MSRSWCIAGFVNIVRSYDVFPSLSCYDELSFAFEISFYRIEYFYGFESTWYMSCIWFTWYVFWHSTRGFPRWHWVNLCIGVDACSHLCFSGRNLGELFEFLSVGLSIMNLRLFDAYLIINSQILAVTLEYLGDIRVGWCVSYAVILLRTLELFVTLTGIIQWVDQKE